MKAMFKLNPTTGRMDLVREISDNPESNTAEQAASTKATKTLADKLNEMLDEKSVYIAKLSQAGTDAPTAIVLKDTITGLVWARTGVGSYTLTKAGAFTLNKTVPDKDIYTDQDGNLMKLTRTSADVMTLQTYAAVNTEVLADGVLSGQYFNIEIYS